MKKELLNIIEESLINEVKKTIIKESKDQKEYYHIMCEGEPIDTFESEEIAMKHLDIYKKNHPEKEFIIEKSNYKSPSELIDKLDKMSEELEENKIEKPMKKVKVSSLAEAIMMAKNKNQKHIKVNGESYDVNEMWKSLEEEETDVEESNAFVLAADTARDAGKKEFEFPKGSGKMHKVTLTKDIETKEGKMGQCSECGGMMNEEGACNECGTGNMNETKKIKLRLTESELISLISKMVESSKKMMKESVPGLEVTKKAQSGSKKENESNLKDVEQKLKKASSFDGNDNPEFPKQIGKGEKMTIKTTEEQDEIIADTRGGTMIDLDYDFEPSENFKKRLKMALEGDTKMGNSHEAANVVKKDTGEKLLKSSNRKKEKASKNAEISWGHSWKSPEKVVVVKESKKDEKQTIIEEEIKRMKTILGYNESTQ